MGDRGRGRARRWGGRLLGGLALGVAFSGATVGGAWLHLDTPGTRRVVAWWLSDLTSTLLQGELTVEALDSASLDGLVAREVVVHDPWGNRVLRAAEVRVRADLVAIARDALWGTGNLDIPIPEVRLDGVEIDLLPDPTSPGTPSLAAAFAVVERTVTGSGASAGPPRPVRVWFPEVQVGKVFARGSVGGSPPLTGMLSQAKGNVLFAERGVRLEVERFGAVVSAQGVDARGTGALVGRFPGVITTSFDGWVGELPVAAQVAVRPGGRLSITAAVPRARPEVVRGFIPSWPVRADVDLRIKADGTTAELATEVTADLAATHVEARGTVVTTPELDVDLEVTGRRVDAALLAEGAPTTRVDVDTTIKVYQRDRRYVVDLNGTLQPTRFAGVAIPLVDLSGTVDERGFVARAKLHEPSLPVSVGIHAHPGGAVDVDFHARRFAIERSPRLARLTRATGVADVRGKARIVDGKVDGSLRADLEGVRQGQVRAERATVDGKISGPVARPEALTVALRLDARRVRAGAFAFDRVQGRADGVATAPRVSASVKVKEGPTVTAAARLQVGQRVRAHGITLGVHGGGLAMKGAVRQLDLGAGSVRVAGLALQGTAGEVTGSMHLGPRLVEVDATARGLDLGQLADAFGAKGARNGGVVDGSTRLRLTEEGATGSLTVSVADGIVLDVTGVQGHAAATLAGRRLTGTLTARQPAFGQTEAAVALELAGSPLSLASWMGVTGQIRGSVADVPLLPLGEKLALDEVEALGGTASGAFAIGRTRADDLPSVQVTARTHDLIVTRADGVFDDGLVVRGYEAEAEVLIDGTSGATHARAAAFVGRPGDRCLGEACPRDLVIDASADLTLDLARAFMEPRTLADQLAETPLRALVEVPRRDVAGFAGLVGELPVLGKLGGSLRLTGPLNHPDVDLAIEGQNVALPENSAHVVTLAAVAAYRQEEGELGAWVSASHGGKRIAVIRGRSRVPWDDLAAVADGVLPEWSGSVSAELNDAPLHLVPALAAAEVGGRVSGTATVQSGTGSSVARLTFRDLAYGADPLGDLRFNVASQRDGYLVDATSVRDGGRLRAEGLVRLYWRGLDVELARDKPLGLSLTADGFQLSTLRPVLRRWVSRISGRFDTPRERGTNVARPVFVQFTPTDAALEGAAWSTSISGDGTVSDATVQVTALGLELTNMECQLRAEARPTLSHISIDPCRARARSISDNAVARGWLQIDGGGLRAGGFGFTGQDLPVLLEGVSLGEATGSARLSVRREGEVEDRRYVADVRVSPLVVRLPLSTTRNVIDLRPASDIRITQQRGREDERDEDPVPWTINVQLAQGVRLVRSDVLMPLSGETQVRLQDEAELGGFVDLLEGGVVPLVGKNFVIETGRVRFDTGENTNPRINVVANWRSGVGYTVRAEIRGTYRQSELILSSDPPLPEAQIYELLLYGRLGSATSGQSARFDEYGFNAAALALSQLFQGTALDRVQLSASSAESTDGEARSNYTAAVRISDDVWFEGTYTNTTAAGPRPDSQAGFTGTIDWRFLRNWSLRTEGGNQGAAVDLLFQYRY